MYLEKPIKARVRDRGNEAWSSRWYVIFIYNDGSCSAIKEHDYESYMNGEAVKITFWTSYCEIEEPKTRPMTNEELIDLWYDEPKLKVMLKSDVQPRLITRVDPGSIIAVKVDNQWVEIRDIGAYTTDGKTWKKLEVEV